MSQTPQKLVDYFIISGLDISSGLEPDQLSGDNLHCSPLERSYKPHILAHYPDNVLGNPFDAEAVFMLCHPRGLNFRTQRDNREPKFHSFLITREDGTRAHGAALTIYEEVENREICLAMQTLQAMHMAELSNTQSRTLYPHLSPAHSQHGSPNHKPPEKISAGKMYDQKKDVLYGTKCISIISRLPLVSTFEQFLQSLYDVVLEQEPPALSLISYVYNIIHEVPLLPPGRSMRLTIPKQSIVCQRPGMTELPLLDYSLKELFTLLSLDNILAIFRSVLLEHQVLLFSRDFQRLMLVSEGISALIFPFRWQHVYVPILPASLLHFLDAPVPFIMGLQGTNSKSLFEACSKANMCLVDIDAGTVESPDDLPAFPYMSDLKQDLLQELRRQSSFEDQGIHQRDSGFVRDSYFGSDSAIGSTEGSTSSLRWSISDKLEMLQQNEALSKVMALSQKSGVISSLDDIRESLSDAAILAHRSGVSTTRALLDDHVKDLMFNGAVREIFLHYFLHVFGSYEEFIIGTAQDMESWINNRETMQNFDKTAFLSDHAEEHLHFLSPFTETQMFACFIDNKILAQWEDPDVNLAVFEGRLKMFQDDQTDQRLRKFFRTAAAKEAESMIEKRATIVDIIATSPKTLDDVGSCCHKPGFFPVLSSAVLNKEPAGNRSRSVQWRIKYGLTTKGSEQKHTFEQREKYIQEIRSKTSHQPNLSDMNLKAMVNTNLKFMETLLKECKTKTKRMLVQKMGQEAVDLGHGEVTVVGVEENTLIASLCDLLERIWSHGLQQKQGKSALWSHLVNYNNDHAQKNQENQPLDQSHISTDLSSSVALDGSCSCPSGTQTWPIRRQHRRKPSRGPELPALDVLPVSVLFDMRNVQQMTEIKTDVGYARAFVRLSLEKKLLSKHLKELLSNQELLRSLYKRYAFLRCEDEREQFLYHLLSLNAVDYNCFTNTFTTTVIVYHILVFPRLKLSGGTTTANCWLSLAGQLGETDKLPLPKHMLDITVQNKNLGILTTMRIGHDNGGISPKWMVEHVLVRNEVTGQTYRFPCGRWLGKGADDGALERLLVAEPVPPTVDANELMEKCRTPPRCRSPSVPRKSNEPRLPVSEIQEKLSDVVNHLVKHFCKPEKERGSATGLLCGEYGLVYCMEHVFQYGFKSSRLFRNRVFIWDFLEKVLFYLETLLSDTEHYQIAQEISTTMQSYCYVVSCINHASESLGKDGRFQIFICIGIRDRLLQRWIKLISKTPITASMYEEQSFLRDPSLVQFLMQILDSLKEFQISLEASLIKGVNL